ncbi:MAG: hypothetical protein Q9160_008620 [Pyrenula sp. 1 TL-2023]
MAAFYAASILSSQISTTPGSEVLLSNTNCGAVIPPDAIIERYRNWVPYEIEQLNSAAAYAQQCYSKTSLPQVCSTSNQENVATFDIPVIQGISSLKARSNFGQSAQGPLPADQWQQEVISWESTSLADIQRSVVEAVAGPSDPSIKQYVQSDVKSLSVDGFCVEQKIKSTAYTNFSVLGLIITLAVGGLIVVVSNVMEPICTFFIKRRKEKRYKYKRLEWITNETLQLQRLVHEEFGLGTWSGASSSIPVTEKNEKLGTLDISNEDHPIMTRSAFNSKPEKLNGGSENVESAPLRHSTVETPSESHHNLDDPMSNIGSSSTDADDAGQHVHAEGTLTSPDIMLPSTSLSNGKPGIDDRRAPSPENTSQANGQTLQDTPLASSSPSLQPSNRMSYPNDVHFICKIGEQEREHPEGSSSDTQ